MLNQKINVAKLFFILVVMDTTILTTASPFYPLEMQCLNTSKQFPSFQHFHRPISTFVTMSLIQNFVKLPWTFSEQN